MLQLKAGAEKQRKKLLKKARIVGVTCCSISQPLLDSLAFDFCVLDECSQIVEPPELPNPVPCQVQASLLMLKRGPPYALALALALSRYPPPQQI